MRLAEMLYLIHQQIYQECHFLVDIDCMGHPTTVDATSIDHADE